MVEETRMDGASTIVFGASSGIGHATALLAAEEGASVALAARRQSRLNEIADTIRDRFGTPVLPMQTDVTDADQVDQFIESAAEEFGSVDHVIYSAGEGRSASTEEMTDEEYRIINDVLIDGAFYAARAAIPHLKDSSGSLVLMGSFAANYPYPNNAVYGAAKWWTRGFAYSLAGELGRDDIAVTVVNPSEVRTEWGSEEGKAFKEQYGENEALEPGEIAEAIIFSVSQSTPAGVNEINLYRRDRISEF